MKYLPTYVDGLITNIQRAIALKGIASIKNRSFFIKKEAGLYDVDALFCCLEAVTTWKFYDYGRSTLCPITEKEFDNIVSLTLNTIGTW